MPANNERNLQYNLIAQDQASRIFRRLNKVLERTQRLLVGVGTAAGGTTRGGGGAFGGQNRQLSSILRESKRHTAQFNRIISGLSDVRNAVLISAQRHRPLSVPRPSGIVATGRQGVTTNYASAIPFQSAGRGGLPLALAAGVAGGNVGSNARYSGRHRYGGMSPTMETMNNKYMDRAFYAHQMMGKADALGWGDDSRDRAFNAATVRHGQAMEMNRRDMVGQRRRGAARGYAAGYRAGGAGGGGFGGLVGRALPYGIGGYFGFRALHAPYAAAGRKEGLELTIGANTGDSALGKRLVAESYQFANVTPYSGEEIARSAASLSGTISDPAKNMAMVKALTAISAATPGKDVQGITRAVAKMFARGQASLEGLEPLLTAGINIPGHYQKYAAQSNPALAKMSAEDFQIQFFDAISKGKIKNSHMQAFLLWFGEQMKDGLTEYTTSIGGLESTLGSAFDDFLISTAFPDAYKAGLQGSAAILRSLTFDPASVQGVAADGSYAFGAGGVNTKEPAGGTVSEFVLRLITPDDWGIYDGRAKTEGEYTRRIGGGQ